MNRVRKTRSPSPDEDLYRQTRRRDRNGALRYNEITEMYFLRTCALTFSIVPFLVGCGSGGTAPFVGPLPPFVSPVVPAIPVGTCVTFIGDSLTQYWPMENLVTFDGGCYLNHGIGGTTMPQILDGIDDKSLPYDASVDPSTSRIVVVGGDVFNSLSAGLTLAQIEGSYTQVIKKLQGMGVKVVLCTLLPSYRKDFNQQVLALNTWIRAKASDEIAVADVYIVPPLVLPGGTLNPSYTVDGLHITTPSYSLLTLTVEAAIHQAGAKL